MCILNVVIVAKKEHFDKMKQKHIDEIVERLYGKSYADFVEVNTKYLEGKCNILYDDGKYKMVCYKIEPEHHEKSYRRVVLELIEWSSACYAHHPKANYYGVYKAVGIKPTIICRNGVLRRNLKYPLEWRFEK